MLATLAQCAHTCVLQPGTSGNDLEVTDRSLSVPCLACLIGQAIVVVTALLLAVALLAKSHVRLYLRLAPVMAWHGYVVSVRPPPFA